MRIHIENYVAWYVVCAHHKGKANGPAIILQYPPPKQPWSIVTIDLFQLPRIQYGSQFLLVCVDNFLRFVVLSPMKNKTVTSIGHTFVTYLFCLYSIPRVLLSDNGAEFRNVLISRNLFAV